MQHFNVSRLIGLFFVCLCFLGQNVFAQATLSVQGVIKNSDGTAVDNGKYSLTFKLYEAESGGAPVWSETQDNVQVTGGIYSALLGSTTAMTAAFDKTYYLGLSVEGGAELIPRAKLTSSPYALSLIGTGNTFPSSGVVGVGTASPTAGNELHVKDAAGEADLLVESPSSTPRLSLKRAAKTGRFEINGSNQLVVAADNDQNMGFFVEGQEKLSLNTDHVILRNNGGNIEQHIDGTNRLWAHSGGANVNGTLAANTVNASGDGIFQNKIAVGQSSVESTYRLKVNGESWLNGYTYISGSRSWNPGLHVIHGNQLSLYQASAVFPFGLDVEASIRCYQFWANSDRRIKKDFHHSESLADLNTLAQLRVTDYRHIDASKGADLKKGFIAQEVKEVFPEAVTLSEDFIPNVYALSSKTALANGSMTIYLDKNHDLAVGDEVKMETATASKTVKVTAVLAPNTFAVAWNESPEDKVFVYGKKVKDFHTVDYDRIFTLNVSATQELARRMLAMEKENAALRSALDAEKTERKASAEKMEARLRVLENKLSN